MKTFVMKDGVAVITGAASGIGAELAAGLAARGCHLALVDVDETRLTQVAERLGNYGVRISRHVTDVSDPEAADSLAADVQNAHGRVTMLFNNAGVALGGFFDEVPPEKFDWLMQVNFHGPVRLIRAFLPLLEQAEQAQIINTSSVFGLIGPPEQTAYSASKFALRGFSESLRNELADSTVGVTTVHPGGVNTRIVENAILSGDREAAEKRAAEFRKNLKLPPEKAAEIILKGVERRRARILVGSDARFIDIIQRLLPVGHARLLSMVFGGTSSREATRNAPTAGK